MSQRVYFYIAPPGTPGEQTYQHPLICLAEGLRDLGVPFHSNIDYWKESPDSEGTLIKHDPNITPDDCSIVVIDLEWMNARQPLPERLFHKGRNYATVYTELHEQWYSILPQFCNFDFILRGSYNRRLAYHDNCHPWGYGISGRILRETSATEPNERKRSILHNFRHARYPHSVRALVARSLIPKLSNVLEIDSRVDDPNQTATHPYHKLHWEQTGRRHYAGYYARLRESLACACFGGYFISPYPRAHRSRLSRALKRFITAAKIQTRVVEQWDSWRFWESFAAGCATFHVDMDKYGCELPVMPRNWEHYVGIDFNNIERDVARIHDQPELLETIGRAGQKWALTHYGSVPTAQRFLNLVTKN